MTYGAERAYNTDLEIKFLLGAKCLKELYYFIKVYDILADETIGYTHYQIDGHQEAYSLTVPSSNYRIYINQEYSPSLPSDSYFS